MRFGGVWHASGAGVESGLRGYGGWGGGAVFGWGWGGVDAGGCGLAGSPFDRLRAGSFDTLRAGCSTSSGPAFDGHGIG